MHNALSRLSVGVYTLYIQNEVVEMALKCSTAVKQKLAEKHGVNLDEVQQCFANREGGLLEDTRENHKSDPPTQWFIAETDYGRTI